MSRLMKIAIIGAECTGKTTLANDLVAEFQKDYPTTFAHEYLRLFVEQEKRTPQSHEQVQIAQEQKSLEDRLSRELLARAQCNQDAFLFCDTTPLLTSIYSEWVFGKRDALVDAIAATHDYDLTLFTQVDFPWISDGIQRDGAKAQTAVHSLIETRLNEQNIPYLAISGSPQERLEIAKSHINKWLES
jgi:nicotinamide riboside kinase